MTKEKENFRRPKPVVLIVLDGWGVYQEYPGNAVALANTPTFDSLIAEYPATTLRASDEAVGLPWGEAGNSEVGHLSLGLGRILYQGLPRIDKDISDHSFYENEVLLEVAAHVKKNNSRLHYIGLVSNGGVHASIDHLYALVTFAQKQNIKELYLHVILDGRDTSYNAGLNFVKGVENTLKEKGVGKIATVSGRSFTMDRNNNWDRTEKAYQAIVEGKGETASDAIVAVEKSYKKKVYDEEFVPTVIDKNGMVKENDAVIFFNFRPDRARQLTKAFVEVGFSNFKREYLNNLLFATFVVYEKGLPVKVLFPPYVIKECLGVVLANNGLKQLRIAETEKYAHVTYFFNGGIEKPNEGEERILIPSPAVASYDLKPEMSAFEVTKKLVEAIESDKYDFILVNYANADMVGHTGNLPAAIKAVEAVDKCLSKVVRSVLLKNGLALVTADHGNAEVMFNMQTGQIDKEHTSNPVPFILVGKEYAGRNVGWPDLINNDLTLVQPQGFLSDIAPTILGLMGLERPKEIRGMNLVK